jgi:hypothetical protein
MNYQRTNILTGWAVWLVATIVYLLTIEPTASFWDCGEFIASAYKLEVGHPPGAPLFMLLGRLFAIMAPGYAALSINVLSALASSFTILFLFWSITHFAKKLADKAGPMTKGSLIAVMGSGIVGGLAYTFSDSFWFSAVEGEVYALSSLFTAVVFWAILKWESEPETKNEARWIIFIAYMMGLSIGVHLLNLLAIPAMAFVYYFKKHEFSWKGFIITGAVGVGILGFVQYGIVQGFIKMAASFELFFINQLSLPFNFGLVTYALLIVGIIAGGLWYAHKKHWVGLHTIVLSFMVILIGYSTFAMIVIRSYANPPMDENNPEHVFAMLAYLNREQYGNRPLLFGEYFTTPTDLQKPYTDGPKVWMKSYSVKEEKNGKINRIASFRNRFQADKMVSESADRKFFIKEEYIETGEKKASVPNYRPEYSGVFPRMYSSQADHVQEYKIWSDYQGYVSNPRNREKIENMEANRSKYENDLYTFNYFMNDPGTDADTRKMARERFDKTLSLLESVYKAQKPTYGEDFRYFTSYQMGWMYFRYFMWNYAGKQNDNQGHGDILNGNWLSGVDWVDQERLGNRSQLSETALSNKAYNRFYFLPLLLGVIGIFLQLLKAPKDLTVTGLLFLMTGVAIVIYLNQYPNQPRERDYAYAGSFYAFAIWIGLGVYALYHAFKSFVWKDFLMMAGGIFATGSVLYLIEAATSGDHGFSYAIFFMGVLTAGAFAVMTALKGQHEVVGASLAFLICLPAPVVMAYDGWDDHSRAKRRTAVDFAKNYLDTLAPNAIIFTNGDNDTFPLWYAQEVEDYRTDVRVVNLSLLNTDWYIDQMKRKAYESNPVPFAIDEVKYRQGTRDVVILDAAEDPGFYMNLHEAMAFVVDDKNKRAIGDNKEYSYFPSRNFALPVDTAAVLAMGIIRPEDRGRLQDTMRFSVNRSYILKSNLMVLDLLATNNWERPVYFAVTTGADAYMGLSDFFQLEGLAYRLLPVKQKKSKNPNILGGIASEIMYDNVMNKFQWGNMDYTEGRGIYLDENNRRMVTNFRLQMSNLAETLISEKKDSLAIAVLDKAIAMMPEKNAPYDRVLLPMIENYYKAGETEKAAALSDRLFELMESEIAYFSSLEPKHALAVAEEFAINVQVCGNLEQFGRYYDAGSEHTAQMKERFEQVVKDFEDQEEEINQILRRTRGRF